jgi:hypothetical protein
MENTFDLRKYLVENSLTPNSKFIKEQQLSPEEQDAVDYVLGLDEAVLGDIVSRAKEIARKGLLKGAVLATLLATPNIAPAQKAQIQQIASTTTAAPTQKAPTSAATYASKTQVPGTIKTINFSENFASGQATLTNKDVLAQNVEEMKQFLNGKDASKFKVVIVAGESQVTNPKGFEKKGSLAQARAQAVENEIKGLGFKTVDIQTKIGTTSYKPGNDVNDPKYQAEQFVTINIVVNNDICSMKPVDENNGQGTAKNNFVTYDDYVSGKGTLTFTPGQIPDRLVILDANGNIKEDTGYITTQQSKYASWKYTPAYVLELTLKYKTNPKAFTGNKIMKITVKDYNDLKSQLSNIPNASTSGNEIGPALADMEAMISKGQKEFIIYENGKTAKVVDFDEARGDVKVMVYSPVGKTGFGIKGNCTR